MVTQRTDNPRREGYLSHNNETTGLPTGSSILYPVHVAFLSLWTFVVKKTSMLIMTESRC